MIPYRNHSGMYVGHFMHMNPSTSEIMYVYVSCMYIYYIGTYNSVDTENEGGRGSQLHSHTMQ